MTDKNTEIQGSCVGMQRLLRIEQKQVLKRAVDEIEQLRKCRDLIEALERMHLDTFNALVEKSDRADTDALKYIYANQAIGVDSALKTLQAATQLLGIRRVV